MPKETVGSAAVLFTDNHPPRVDSPEYVRTRSWLHRAHGMCVVCGDPKIEDHHSGAAWGPDGLIGLSLAGLEWSLGWAADPKVVAAHVAVTNTAMRALGLPTYDLPITDTASVMAWVDSHANADLPLCKPHHTGRMDRPSPDHQAHEAVGIHEIPFPVWVGQVTCDWARWDMWLGTTGTAAGSPNPDGTVTVIHAHPAHHPGLTVGTQLAADHPLTVAGARAKAAA